MTSEPGPGSVPDENETAVRSVVFHDDYELSILLEADGRLREVLHAVGVDGIEHFTRGSATVVSNARHGDGGASRADEWSERLEILQTTLRPVHYRTTPPGAAPGQPETVECVATPIPTADGKLDSILLQAYDRTSTQRVQAQLRESEARFRLLTETVPQMVWLADADGRVVYFAPQWEVFTGETEADLLAGGFTARVHPDDLAPLAASRASEAEFKAVAFRLRRHDGEYRWLEAEYRGLYDETGTVTNWIGATSDVTDRRADEAARLRWQKREAIGELAGGVAHDFNNVISAILSNATLARQEVKLAVSPETSLTEIVRGAERAVELVQRLLAFSREDAEAPEATPFDVGTVVVEACSLVASTLSVGTTLGRTIAPDLPPVLGSAADLHRVVVNLLTNAGHATDGGGTIEVKVGMRAGQPATAPTIELTVDDSGPGVPEHLLDRIFDPFFTTKAAGKGTGLGLAAAQTIVRDHGGTIDVTNRPEGGARFTVRLPAAADSASAEPAPATGAPAPPAIAPAPPTPQTTGSDGPRVLFVDDEAPLCRLAARALPAHGFSVRTFTDPREALAALTSDPDGVDLLVTDLSMPGFTGLELVDAVRTIRPDLPVVLSSGFLTTANRHAAERLGIDAVLPKPAPIDALVSALEGAIAARRAGVVR